MHPMQRISIDELTRSVYFNLYDPMNYHHQWPGFTLFTAISPTLLGAPDEEARIKIAKRKLKEVNQAFITVAEGSFDFNDKDNLKRLVDICHEVLSLPHELEKILPSILLNQTCLQINGRLYEFAVFLDASRYKTPTLVTLQGFRKKLFTFLRASEVRSCFTELVQTDPIPVLFKTDAIKDPFTLFNTIQPDADAHRKIVEGHHLLCQYVQTGDENSLIQFRKNYQFYITQAIAARTKYSYPQLKLLHNLLENHFQSQIPYALSLIPDPKEFVNHTLKTVKNILYAKTIE